MNNHWEQTDVDIFWGEIAPYEHVVQIYENDGIFLDALAGFVGGGIKANECVVVIATSAHLEALAQRLHSYGILVQTLIEDDRFLPLDAEETLSKFMVDGWPDPILFQKTISEVLEKGTCKSRRVRAFGEMVAILWGQGMNGATVQLEHLWNEFCKQHKFSLFCAYPKSGFTQNFSDSMTEICSCHSKLIDGANPQLTQVRYSNLS